MPLSAGTRIGAYEIVTAIGAGGMGEVYRARDSKLHRDVAIKVLPDVFAGDRERLARFEREAHVLAALNHPNIAQIYGIEDSPASSAGQAAVRALIMELVEGPTLEDRLSGATNGAGPVQAEARNPRPLPVDEALSIARQIADALEAAHEQGIIHRDLKPANIKVRDDGTVKVLDFGLAKALAPDGVSATAGMSSPTVLKATFQSNPHVTELGVVLGTAAYMAPEQARGKAVDKRADIWAFGVVLYQMLTGRSPFGGETVTDALAAVVTREPDWTALPPGVPDAVTRLLRRCLEKDPRQRLRDIGDARVELRAPGESAVESRPAPLPASRRSIGAWIAIAGVAVAAVAGVVVGRFALQPGTPRAAPIRFEISVPSLPHVAIAPDGSRIVFTSAGRLHIRDLDRLGSRELPGTDGAVAPFWSGDSSTVAYGANGKLWRVSVAGGAPAPICTLPGGAWDQDAGGAWLPDGTIVFTNGNSPLYRVPAVGGDPVIVVNVDDNFLHFHDASALPDGRGVLFVIHRKAGADTLQLWADGRSRQILQLEGHAIYDPVYSPTGHILFSRRPNNPGIWAVPFSLERLASAGDPFLVVSGAGRPSISRTSNLAYVPDAESPPGRLAWLNREGRVIGRVEEPRLMETAPVFSPDGTRAAVAVRTGDKWDIWAYGLKTGGATRLTTDGTARRPAWAPDGRSVVYDSGPPGPLLTLKRAAADGSGPLGELGSGRDGVLSSDGRLIFYWSNFDLFYRPIQGKPDPVPFLEGPSQDAFPRPSPDGRFVAFLVNEAANVRLSVVPFPQGKTRWDVTLPESWWPRWSGNGRRLFFATRSDVYEVDVNTDPEFRLGVPRRLFARVNSSGGGAPDAFDVSADGERFLVVEPDRSAPVVRTIVVVLRFAPDLPTTTR